MSGYTNGRMAYMPTAEEWPKGGYEVENSPFGQSAADTLITEILKPYLCYGSPKLETRAWVAERGLRTFHIIVRLPFNVRSSKLDLGSSYKP